MTAKYLGRHFFITKGQIVRLKIGTYGRPNYKVFSKEEENFFDVVVAELKFFAQDVENFYSRIFFRNVALSLDKSSAFFRACQEIANTHGIVL